MPMECMTASALSSDRKLSQPDNTLALRRATQCKESQEPFVPLPWPKAKVTTLWQGNLETIKTQPWPKAGWPHPAVDLPELDPGQ